MKNAFLGASALVLAASICGPALAQTSSGNEEIIVTAEHRMSSVQKTSASITVRSGEELLRSGKSNLAQMLEDVPGVDVNGANDLGQAGLNVTIRGVRNNSDTVDSAAAPSATTAVYTDGVYEGIGSAYDIARVEVLRGPQGTLYGRSATSGVVAFHTADPQLGRLDGFLNVEGGSYDLFHASGALNLPFGDKVALRVAGDEYRRDGFVNGGSGRTERHGARAKLLIRPNTRLSVLLAGAYEAADQGSGGIDLRQTFGHHTIDRVAVPAFQQRSTQAQVWGQVDYQADFATLTLLSSYRHYRKGMDGRDSSYFLFDVRDARAINLIPSDRVYTNEIRLTSNESSPVKWILGAIAYTDRVQRKDQILLLNTNQIAVRNDVDKRVTDRGIFGEITVPLRSDTRLTGGLRYDWTSVDATVTQSADLAVVAGVPILPVVGNTISGAAGRSRFRNFTYKARIEHDLSPRNMVYATVSTGFLPGDLEVGAGAAPAGSPFYGSGLAVPVAYVFSGSTLTAYEIGSKNQFMGNRLQLNGDLYYYDYDGYQQVIYTIPGDPSSQRLIGVPVQMMGAEIEVAYRPAPQTRISLTYGHVTARVHDAPAAYTAAVYGTKVPGVVSATVTARLVQGIQLSQSLRLNLNIDGRYLAPTQISVLTPANQAAGLARYASREGQLLGNLGLGLDIGSNLSVSAYVRNVTDNRYMQSSRFYTALTQIRQFEPRTFGLMGIFRF